MWNLSPCENFFWFSNVIRSTVILYMIYYKCAYNLHLKIVFFLVFICSLLSL